VRVHTTGDNSLRRLPPCFLSLGGVLVRATLLGVETFTVPPEPVLVRDGLLVHLVQEGVPARVGGVGGKAGQEMNPRKLEKYCDGRGGSRAADASLALNAARDLIKSNLNGSKAVFEGSRGEPGALVRLSPRVDLLLLAPVAYPLGSLLQGLLVRPGDDHGSDRDAVSPLAGRDAEVAGNDGAHPVGTRMSVHKDSAERRGVNRIFLGPNARPVFCTVWRGHDSLPKEVVAALGLVLRPRECVFNDTSSVDGKSPALIRANVRSLNYSTLRSCRRTRGSHQYRSPRSSTFGQHPTQFPLCATP